MNWGLITFSIEAITAPIIYISIDMSAAYFAVRAEKSPQFKTTKWKRQMPKNIFSDSERIMTVYKYSNQNP